MIGKQIILSVLLLCSLVACSPRAVHEAQEVVAQADSMWYAGEMYRDSAQLAQAYTTLGSIPLPFTGEGLCPIGLPVAVRRTLPGIGSAYLHACYHYGRLLREKDDPVSAMQVFINATHSRSRDYHFLGRVYSNMGSFCHMAGNFTLSHDMFCCSAKMYLDNADTLLYYYSLNDMAFELSLQKDSAQVISLLDSIRSYPNSALHVKTWETEAQLNQALHHHNKVISLVDSLQAYGYNDILGYTMKARAFNYLSMTDSAILYAQKVVSLAPNNNTAIAAYYILTHDSTLTSDSLLVLSSSRADVQKAWAYSHGKLTQAVQLLEQDINREPSWTWLYSMIATLLIVGTCMWVYVHRKRKQRQLLSQQVNELTTMNIVAMQRHEQIVHKHTEYTNNLVAQVEKNCTVLMQAEDFPQNIHWKDYEAMCKLINDNFGMLVGKLQSIYQLSEKEIRLCVLVVIGNPSGKQLADMLCYSESGIRNYKNRIAKKLGTNSIELREFLINLSINEYSKCSI